MTLIAPDAPTLPDVRLPALDVTAATDGAAASVMAMMPGVLNRPAEERAAMAAAVIGDIADRLDRTRRSRNAAAYTVATTMRVRRGGGVHTALGVGRTRWKTLRDRLAVDPPAVYPNAAADLPELARKTVFLAACLDAASGIRDDAVRELVHVHGWSNGRAGALIDRHATRVSHVRNKQHARAS